VRPFNLLLSQTFKLKIGVWLLAWDLVSDTVAAVFPHSSAPRNRATRFSVHAFESVTLGHIRSHGCLDLLVYCEAVQRNHSAVMNADHWPAELPISSRHPLVAAARIYSIAASR
jgi:hypothetical protein